MYRTHYRLRLKPFQISTDPRFLWLGEKHKEALAILRYGIMDNRGFLLLTGDVGTGKTTLIHTLSQNLGKNILIATVPDPGLEPIDFFNYVAKIFGLNKSYASKGAFLLDFEEFLYKVHRNNKKALLIIDEAQRMNPQLLEEIRLLSNIERQDVKLLNIFFVGQIEFNDFLLDPVNRATRQRITINFNIDPLTENETEKYINHRLKVAGASRNMFSAGAMREIYRFSMGYPRLINIVCDHALLTGYVEGKKTISSKIVSECITELEIPVHLKKTVEERKQKNIRDNQTQKSIPVSQQNIPLKKSFKKKTLLYAGISLLLLMSSGLIYSLIDHTFYTRNKQHLLNWITGLNNRVEADNVQLEKQKINRTEDPILSHSNPSVINDAPVDSIEKDTPQLYNNKIPPELFEVVSKLSDSYAAIEKTDNHEQTNDIEDQIEPVTERYVVVYYTHNSNTLSDEAYALLDRVAATANRNPHMKLDVRGYTDKSGSYEYNLKLSEFRANIVKSYLLGKGINSSKITLIGMGPEDSKAPDDFINSLKSKRRVEIELIPEPENAT